jgi:hypothetical protein
MRRSRRCKQDPACSFKFRSARLRNRYCSQLAKLLSREAALICVAGQRHDRVVFVRWCSVRLGKRGIWRCRGQRGAGRSDLIVGQQRPERNGNRLGNSHHRRSDGGESRNSARISCRNAPRVMEQHDEDNGQHRRFSEIRSSRGRKREGVSGQFQ